MQIITICTIYVSCTPPSSVPTLVVCAPPRDICSGGFILSLGILAPSVARADVVVRDESIAMQPTIPSLHPFFGIAFAWLRAGVGFGDGGGRLTCFRGQLILEGVDFIAVHAIYFLYCSYSAC